MDIFAFEPISPSSTIASSVTINSPDEVSHLGQETLSDDVLFADSDLKLLEDSKVESTELWSDKVNEAFNEALKLYPHPTMKERADDDNGKKTYGRNELISRYILKKTGEYRSRKQVGGRLRRLKKRQRQGMFSRAPSNAPSRPSIEKFPDAWGVNSRSNLDYIGLGYQSNNACGLQDNRGLKEKNTLEDHSSRSSNSDDWNNSILSPNSFIEHTDIRDDDSLSSAGTKFNEAAIEVANANLIAGQTRMASPWFQLSHSTRYLLQNHNIMKLSHVSIPFYESKTCKKPFCRLISMFQLERPLEIELTSYIVSFGSVLLSYKQTYKPEFDKKSNRYIIMADNTPIDNFLEFFCRDTAEVEEETCTSIIISNLAIKQFASAKDARPSRERKYIPCLEVDMGFSSVETD